MKLNKKNIFFLGLLALVFISVIIFLEGSYGRFCVYSPEDGWSKNYCDIFALFLVPLLLVIPFSLLFCFLRDEVFKYWMKFAKWGIATLMIFSFVAGSVHRSGSIGFEFFPFMLSFLYFIFVTISIVMIIYKSWKLRTKK